MCIWLPLFGCFYFAKLSTRKKKDEKARKKRTIWVRQIYEQREKSSMFHILVREMALGDREFYFK